MGGMGGMEGMGRMFHGGQGRHGGHHGGRGGPGRCGMRGMFGGHGHRADGQGHGDGWRLRRAKVVSVPHEVLTGAPGETLFATVDFENNT